MAIGHTPRSRHQPLFDEVIDPVQSEQADEDQVDRHCKAHNPRRNHQEHSCGQSSDRQKRICCIEVHLDFIPDSDASAGDPALACTGIIGRREDLRKRLCGAGWGQTRHLTRLKKQAGLACGRRPRFAFQKRGLCQAKAKASKLEHNRTKPATVTARNPSDTMSWLRMIHLLIRCSSEFIKVFETISLRPGDACLSLVHALERTPSNAWARKTPTLTRPINAVTASNIAKFPLRPGTTKRRPPCTVKKNPGEDSKSDAD